MLQDLNAFINKKDPKTKTSAAAASPNATMFQANQKVDPQPNPAEEEKNALEAGESININNQECLEDPVQMEKVHFKSTPQKQNGRYEP